MDIWDFTSSGDKPEIREAAESLQEWLVGNKHKLANLLLGKKHKKPDKGAIKDLECDIIREFKPLRKSIHYLQALSIVINRGNESGYFDLCPPRIPILVKRDKSPFLPGCMSGLSLSRGWRNALFNSAMDGILDSDKEEIGRVMASAALNGGLVDTSLLLSFYNQLGKPIDVSADGRAYMELRLPWRGKEDMELRRWFPDPLTEILLLKLSSKLIKQHNQKISERKQTTNDAWGFISAFLKNILSRNDKRPRRITHFLSPIQLELKTRIPSFLESFSERAFVSHAVKDYVWLRIHGVRPTESVDDEKYKIEKLEKNVEEDPDENPFTLPWLVEIRRSLAGKDKKVAANRIATLKQERDIPNTTMHGICVDWAQYLMSAGSVAENALSLSTIRSYVSQIGARVTGLSGFDDITSLAREAMEELYQQILEDAQSRHHRRNLARGLREFHHFLVKVHHADPIDVREVLGIGTTLSPVDANLITIDEYHEILNHLDAIDLDIIHPDFVIIAKLIFILAFRCGFRRKEVLKLRIDDIHDDYPAELLVCPYVHRRLKTKSATRKLPLYALLEPDEMKLLHEWKAARIKQEKEEPRFEFLFSIPERGYSCVPEETVFPVLHRAMRQVTGDPTLRFHHLRHSFASWTFLRLVLSDLSDVPDIFPDLPKTTKYLNQSKLFRRKLYGNERPTRKHLFAVASMLGHSGPDISLEHYIHFCDLALSAALNSNGEKPKRTIFVKASGLDSATAYRKLSADGISGLINSLRKQYLTRVQRISYTKARLVNKVALLQGEKETFTGVIERLWKYLYLRSARNIDREELAQRFGFSIAQIEAMESRATHIRDLKTKEKGPLYRHRLMEEAVDKRQPQDLERLLCPRRPHLNKDQMALERLAPAMWQLICDDSDRVAAVLDYYIENAWQTRNELIFHNPDQPEQAQAYMQLLIDLGIKKQEIRFVSYSKQERSCYASQWKKALGLTWREQVEHLQSPNKKSHATEQWFGIKPVFGTGSDAPENGAYGLRYLFVMTAIHVYCL